MNLKKIIILLILIIPNIVNADFFEDITNKIEDNPKGLATEFQLQILIKMENMNS